MVAMRALSLLLIVGLLTAAFVPLVVAEDMRHRDHRQQWRDIPETRRNAGLQRAETHGMFARLNMDEGGNVSGRYVSFHFAESIGTIHDLTAKFQNNATKFFDAVTPSPYASQRAPYVTGSVFRAAGSGLTIRVHNNPVAHTAWHAETQTQITFDLANGITVANATARQVRLAAPNNTHGHIVTNANASIEVTGGLVKVTLRTGEHVFFASHAPAGPANKYLHATNALMEKGRLGGVYFISDGDGQAVVDDFDVDTGIQVASIARGRVAVQAESDVQGPRVLLFIVDPDTIDGMKGNLRVKLNDAVLANVTSPEALAQGAEARVHVVPGQKMTMVFVRVPHFSTQNIVIEEAPAATGSPAPTTSGRAPTLGVWMVLGVLAVFAVLSRRRQA